MNVITTMDRAADADLLARIAPGNDVTSRFAVNNPATGTHIADVADMDAEDTARAVVRAKEALPDWAARTAKERAAILSRWHDLILDNQEALATLLTREQGKPIAEALGEIVYGASFVEWFAEEGKRAYGDVIPTNAPGRRLLVLRQPVGVVGAITPWNFPVGMVTRKVAPALAAGCTIVLKPAEDTPLSALALATLARDAGFPEGVLEVVTSARAESVARVLTDSPDIRKLSFTGSTRVGKLLMAQCAGTVKKLSLELGGNAPFIVFDDADIDAAVAGAIQSKFRNAGQTCVCANRLFVQSGVADEFAARFAAAVEALPVGEGLVGGNAIGPLINSAAVEKVDGLVRDALAKGAHCVVGGGGHALGGNFYAPTILTGVDSSMEIASAEIFGPVAPIMPFETEAEVVARANDTPYGLAAYFWTRDLGRAWRVAEQLEYGMIGLNEGIISSEAAPFGGVKESGVGREGSKYGLDEFLELKYFTMGGLSAR
ncbi:NAD-dependent succinate-semialdehyde dehydrogenase [Altererythrobacter sp. C41]|uniref:NAD-dependent succinate-semialdehyde dehydrogenase n=1 Tax=Altererythrobacter sp. C41 TaxID=2806021 RepID=UPI001EE3C319|nr:NAD-dependent succinate-semialdehyde dehydrogenase [Altererythrobacter sp. C41]